MSNFEITMKHAYLIIAHNEFGLLQTLIDLLDDARNDIYIHIDKKVKALPHLTCKNSRLSILENRIDARWGDRSLIVLELFMFKSAYKNGPYEYYHLLSGVDMPLKSQDELHEFLHENNKKEFVGFAKGDFNERDLHDKVFKYHLYTKHYKNKNILLKIFWKALRTVSEFAINTLFKRKKDDIVFKKGCNWVSITNDFCKYLLSKEDWILERFKHTCCGDEIFLQTVLWSSPFRNNVYNHDIGEYEGCLRYIDWNRGNPYVWGKEPQDFETLQSSDYLFARKFSSEYPDIIQKIIQKNTVKR